MNQPDEMLAIETHDGQHIPRTYPALMNGSGNHIITSAMTPYNTPKSSIVVPANMSKGSMMGNPAISSNNYPSLDYGNHSAMMPAMNGGRIPEKYMAGNYHHMDAMKSGKSALPSILPPNHGAVQPYSNGIDTDDDENDRRLELEYMAANQQKKKDLVQENNKKNEAEKLNGNVGVAPDQKASTPSSSTITNNGNIKIAIATEINMANLMANTHQCK